MKYTDSHFNLDRYMTGGVRHVVEALTASTFFNKKERSYMLKFAKASRSASKVRAESDKNGEHIPPFLICSITTSCNLHCAGCYARKNDICNDEVPADQLTAEEWQRVFLEAEDMGVSFILLAGGEPMVRQDVLNVAGNVPDILFPVFTNGTMINEKTIDLFDDHRNIVPIISIEGEQALTDTRRGAGVYHKIVNGMQHIQDRGLIFGASITVTKQNLKQVTSDEFIEDLEERGCKGVIFVEYVPVTEDTKNLAPEDPEREYLHKRIRQLKLSKNMVFISFPGDEKTSGGCLAAGRGFFHINPHGGAEPCPFSPYSDINIRNHTLREALHSHLFETLQADDLLKEDHEGGCVLYERRNQVESIANSQRSEPHVLNFSR